jgi:hypothetical protein
MTNTLLSCTACNQSFRSRAPLNNHVRREHQSTRYADHKRQCFMRIKGSIDLKISPRKKNGPWFIRVMNNDLYVYYCKPISLTVLTPEFTLQERAFVWGKSGLGSLTVLTPEFTLQERAFVWGKSGLGSRRRRFLRSWNACDLRWWNETIEGPIRRMKGHRTIELDILRRTELNSSN